MTVRVVTAAASSSADRATIAAGVPSRALMQRAGAAAAGEIARRYADRLTSGVAVFAGAGNNGGDGWVVARCLAAAGVAVSVVSVGEPRTDDARAEMELTHSLVQAGTLPAAPAVVVDALLGTGASGAPRGEVAGAIATIAAMRARGAAVVALDVPSGVDATRGTATDAVVADLTVTFGSMKRGLLVARAHAGTIVVVDIGLANQPALDAGAPWLLDAPLVRSRVPGIAVDAHKGTRGKVLVVGGAPGMAGATILAGQAAMRSGAGMVQLVVASPSLPPVQGALPAALAARWPRSAGARERLVSWGDVMLLGPGLGASDETRLFAMDLLAHFRGPVVLDADALNVFAGRLGELEDLLAGRPAVLTPHPGEFARLLEIEIDDVLAERFEIGARLAERTGATVLLKGVPTVVSDAGGAAWVSASGGPALATAGSGDVLGGIVATLLAQGVEPTDAAACGAWVHGRAGELAAATNGGARGTSLDDVLAALPAAWSAPDEPLVYPVIAELPRTGAGA